MQIGRKLVQVLSLAAIMAMPSFSVSAEVGQISVLGLFKNKALVMIDGQRRVLRKGHSTPEGVMLIESNSQHALLSLNGQEEVFYLGEQTAVTNNYRKPVERIVQIWRNDMGMYSSGGLINGQSVDFLVDTGASKVAMSSAHARLMGLDFESGNRGLVSTAGGRVPAYEVMLDRVKVGDISLNNVEALVVEGDSPSEILLGMSFLNRVKMENTGTALLLKQLH